MAYQIAVCDDNEMDIQYVSLLVKSWAERCPVQARISTFASAESFLFYYAENQGCDILLLDVEMGKMDGVSLAKHIRKTNEAVQIIFITGYPDYIAEGYDVSALHYLLKPVNLEKLSTVLDRAVNNLGKNERPIVFMINGEAVRTEISEVISIEAFAHSCAIATVRDHFEVKSSISDIERSIGDGFIRCHRSYIVGIQHIRSISRTGITLDDGSKIPLSRSNYDAVNQAFIRYFRGD